MQSRFLSIILSISSLLSLGMQQVEGAQSPPPTEIPPQLYNEFTLGGRIPVGSWYIDESFPPTKPLVFTKEAVDANLARIARREQGHYGGSLDLYLYDALDKFKDALRGKTVAIVGSQSCWYESIVLFYGGKPTTIEYNKIISADPRLEVFTVEEFERNPKLFDVVISISSIEHDGLGRYGDPINPFGDFIAMHKIKSMLKKNGLFILAVPIGKDRLWWNVHRIYGRIRFPMLINAWNLVSSFGFKDTDLDRDQGINAWGHQPVFVLKVKSEK